IGTNFFHQQYAAVIVFYAAVKYDFYERRLGIVEKNRLAENEQPLVVERRLLLSRLIVFQTQAIIDLRFQDLVSMAKNLLEFARPILRGFITVYAVFEHACFFRRQL